MKLSLITMPLSIIILITLTILNACALYGPDYKKPVIESGVWYSQDTHNTIESNIYLPNIAWWQNFHDPILNQLMLETINNNNNIQIALGNVEQAKSLLQQVNMNWIPNISANAGYSNLQSVGSANNAPLSIFNTQNGYGAGFVPNYSLNILQQLRTQDVYKANLEASIYSKNAIRLTVIGQLVASYFTLLANDEQLKLQTTLTNDTHQQLIIAKAQYQEGYISLLTLQQYEIDYYNAKAQIPIIQNNIIQTQNTIRVLINKNPGYIKRAPSFNNIKFTGLIPINLPSEVLKNRPDILMAEAQLRAANASIGVATTNFFPNITLTGMLGSASNSLNNLFNSSNSFWQEQATINMPLLNLNYWEQIWINKDIYYSTYYNYMQVVRSAFLEVDNNLSNHDKITQSYDMQSIRGISSKAAYDISVSRLHEGLDSNITMLNYKIKYDNIMLSLLAIKLLQMQSIVSLYQALAGGYNINNHNEVKKLEI